MLRIAVFATTAKGVFSGGRYHAMMIAQVLARLGHEAYYVTTNVPVFAADLAPISPDNPVRIVQTNEFDVAPAAPFDAVFIAPQMSLFPRLYKNAVRFARESGAALILINYESPNWFNAFSPAPRPAEKWREWMYTAKEGALVLCSARESEKFARDYYTDLPPQSSFDVWQPAINSVACNETPEQERRKLIILFSRPSDAHKGGGDVADLIGPELAGYTIGLIIGNPKDSEALVAELTERGKPHDVQVEAYFTLSDRQKFILLKRAAAVVFCSYFEGYGYPPLEAMAADTPCVAYDLPVVRENCGDLIRYAPVGDVEKLRSELVAALKAGPTGTAADDHVVFLTDVDARGRALEKVIERQREHLRQVRADAADVVVQGVHITPASIVHMRRRPHALFVLGATHPIIGVATTSAGVVSAQILPGTWDGTAWRHHVLLTLADKQALKRLSEVVLDLQLPTGRLSLPLDRLTVRRGFQKALPKTSLGLTKAFVAGDRALLAGWVYPERAYDALVLIDEKGVAVPATTGIKNLHYKKTFPVDPTEFCGFITEALDLTAFAPGALRVLLIDRGAVVATGQLNTRGVLEKPDPLPLVGETTEPAEAAEGEPASPAVAPVVTDVIGAVVAVPTRLTTHTVAAPEIRSPTGMDRFVARATAYVRKTFTFPSRAAPAKPAALVELAPPHDYKWAVSECNYLEDSAELRVRGWTNEPDRLRAEIWDVDLNHIGTATEREPRADVARELKIKNRTDFGFVYQKPFDGKLDQPMIIRLMDGPRIVAQKIIDRIKPVKATQLKVDDFLFDPQWQVLWMRGTYESTTVSLVSIEVARGTEVVATAAIEEKANQSGKSTYRWRVEDVVDVPPFPGEVLTLRVTCGDGAVRRVAYTVPEMKPGSVTPMRERDELRYAETGDPLHMFLKFSGDLPKEDATRRILVIVHNLNAIERGEKREVFLRLREVLNRDGIDLVFLHHAKGETGCALPEINFYSKDLDKVFKNPSLIEDHVKPFGPTGRLGGAPAMVVDADGVPVPGAVPARPEEEANAAPGPVVDEATMNYAQRMLYGFVQALNRKPKPWSDIEKQTAEELAKIDIVMKLVRPSLVLLWHQWNSLMVIARAAADHYHVPSAIIHEGMLPGTMTIDALGMMAESDATGATLAATPENAAQFERARHVIEEIRTRGLDRKPHAGTPAATAILRRQQTRGIKSVFYAGVNDWQSGNLPSDHPRAKAHSPLYKETMDGLQALLRTAERLDFMVLFKPHPNLFPRPVEIRDERLIYVREANATDCISATDATVTLLSSLAYISLAHRKPTVLLGRNTLSGCGAAYERTEYGDLDACMRDALDGRDHERRQEKFEAHVAALLKSHLFPYGDLTDFSMLSLRDAADKLESLMNAPSFAHL